MENALQAQVNSATDAINIVSGAYATPFVDALHEVCEDDSIQGICHAIAALGEEMVDNAALGEKPQIAMRPAVELSYLPAEEQRTLLDAIESEDCTPSHVQTMKMREFSGKGQLNQGVILSIMQEEKPNQVEQFKLPREKISKFFAPGTPAQKIENDIIRGLELLRQRERRRDDAR
jgi:hypothetical protein